MPHDSAPRAVGPSTPNESATQQESTSSYSCNLCVLIFKTKFYLYEHLHQVHGLSIEAALKDSGLKSLPQGKSKPEHKFKALKSDFAFSCKNCNFRSCNWSIFNAHKNQCSGNSNHDSLVPKASALFKQQKSPTFSKDSNSVKATWKSTPKDVKIYSKSPQTITKYFTATSTMTSDHHANEKDVSTLRLEDSSLKSCGVFQVTATSIDMAQGTTNTTHLLSDLISDPTSAKPIDPFKEATLNNPSKRILKESAVSHSPKKAKLETDQPIQAQTPNCAELSFEVSDDEEGKDAVKSFFCKQCNFKSVSIEQVYCHYEENHPYLRCNSLYIEEKSDQSATYRCLECPVEFSSDTQLRVHYSKDHPSAPDIFTLKSADMNLVYKCFVCPFTSSALNNLRDHQKENHPSHKVDDLLLHCKYSSSQNFVYDIKRRNSEEHQNLEIFLPERSITPCQDESSLLNTKPTNKAQDENLYNCGKCSFSHKSVVVLHVHYKKCHPEEPITLDKIKQSVNAASVTAAPQEPDMEIDLSQSVVKEESWASSLSDPENISENISVDQNLQPALLTTYSGNPSSPSFNQKMFFCDQCTFSNSNIKSVVSHHIAKHGLTTTIEDVVQYSATMEHKNASSKSNSVTHEYPCAQELYYCQICNYGNPTLKGLISHQNKIHEMCRSKEHVLQYTAKIHEQIEKSKSCPTNSILPSGLPLPLVKGKSALFFCFLCNYRFKNITVIGRHFFKVHKGYKFNSKQIAEYSAMVSERLQIESQIKATEKNHTDFLDHSKDNMKVTKPQTSGSHAPASEVRLKCCKCSYGAHYVYLMRKHLINTHKTKMSFSDVVRYCGTGPQFEPGFYCDVCSFRCEDVAAVKAHGIQRHCGRSLSIEFMSSQLYLSPDTCDPKKTSSSFNNNEVSDGISAPSYPDAYSCKACSFKGTSFSSITSHYQTVHPCSVKESESLLDVGNNSKKQSLSDKEQDYKGSKQDFDSYQAPLDFDTLKDSTEKAKTHSCSYCPAIFEEHGGLMIHMGMKHRYEIKETPQLAKCMQIFKCHSCSYVNNIKIGVLSHSKMKHPNKALKSESFYIESEHLQNVQMKVKNGNWKFCGYICKECSQVHPSKERLKEHVKTHKKQPVLITVTSTQDNSKTIHEEIWCQYCGLFCASAKVLNEHLGVCPKNNSKYTCALCQDAFCTKVQLGLHYSKKHGEEAFLKHYAPLYNQPSDKTVQQKETSISNESTASRIGNIRMFKCPSCRYVNSRHHGTLTHCQMRHPNIVVRAETLKIIDIDTVNMIGYMPNSKSYGGFRCKKCPLIYGALKKLKKHCETDHSSRARASSQLSDHNHQTPDYQNVVSESASASQTKFVTKFRHFFKCSMCSFSTSILKSLGRHYRNRHGKSAYTKFYSPLFNQASKPKTEHLFKTADETQEKATPQVRVYKCSICSYSTPYRRYLIAHFRNRHKLDEKALNKQMEKYKNWESTLPIGRFTCKKCPSVFFASKGRLLTHYVTVHTFQLKMDFTVVAERKHRTTGVYRCNRCKQKIFGIKNICKHLDHHRARLLKNKPKETECENAQIFDENVPSALYPVEEEDKLEVRNDETIKVPPVSSVPHFDAEVPEKLTEAKHTCLRCKRTFMSLKGLRSHERSHVAFAALDNLTTNFQDHIDQYIVYRPGTTRPYMCTLCPYRTTVLGLSKSHFLKNHRYVSNSTKATKHTEEANVHMRDSAPNGMDEMNVDGDEEPENSFLEPPDVQRQLKHYNVMAQINPGSKIQNIQLNDSRMLPCEMCNFNSHHYSNMRRHYLRRHGKKLIRCKDCSFFTCFKQNLDLHEQMGHSCVQSEPTHQKNLCCPFCLYQSKNKNNMIDHIVLHREERLRPIEVRRSKLSRYLQGIVFRCYKCTFTSGSADSLDLHMAKHNDIKPFKCRLCYFDCTQLRDLEAHLCDKHQVVRNHQLVGQVNLDQLEEKQDRNSPDEDDEYVEVLHYPTNNEQALKNEQPNMKMAEGAEHSAKEDDNNEHVLKESMSLDAPNLQDLPGQNSDEKLQDHTDNDTQSYENACDNQVQTEGRDDVSESSMEGHSKVQQDNRSLRDVHCQKEIRLTESLDDPVVDDAAAVDSIQDSTSNSEVQKASTEEIVNSKNGLSPPRCAELQSHEVQVDKQSLRDVNVNSNDGQTHNQPNSCDETSPYREMPILEKYFKEQHFIFAQHCENSEKFCTMIRDTAAEVDKTEDQETLNPPVLLATDVAAVHPPVIATMFPCDLCGRNLANTSELQRHMMRHGM